MKPPPHGKNCFIPAVHRQNGTLQLAPYTSCSTGCPQSFPPVSSKVERFERTFGCQGIEAVLHVPLHDGQPLAGVLRLHGFHTALQQLQLILQGVDTRQTGRVLSSSP